MSETKILDGKNNTNIKRSRKGTVSRKTADAIPKNSSDKRNKKKKDMKKENDTAKEFISNSSELLTPAASNSDNCTFVECINDCGISNSKVSKKKSTKKSRSEVMLPFDYYDDLLVEESKIHGKGIFTPVEIKEKTLIMEYKGEVIGKLMSDKREKFYNDNNFDSIYMFTVSDDMIIDATLIGNKARYINHSCNPNCEAINCMRDKSIKYCSIRPIKANEELTINYNMPLKGNENCSCGADNCITKFKQK